MQTKGEKIFISDYDYDLPADRIAHFPLNKRDESKLLVVNKGIIKDSFFKEIDSLLPPKSYLVLNNTKVIEARIFFQKQSGGFIEIFCLEPFEPTEITIAMVQTKRALWHCLIGGASKWKYGLILEKNILVANKTILLSARYIKKEAEDFLIEFTWTGDVPFGEVLHAAGAIPLPPYIKREAIKEDAERYQTIFAQHRGSVAAPTAALHFTNDVFERLVQKNIHPSFLILHVGAGTFKPVKSETIAGHQMHGENFSVSKKMLQELVNADMIVAVGTTSLRTLESLYWMGLKLNKRGKDFDFSLNQWEAYELEENHFNYKESLSILIDYLEETDKEYLMCRTSLLIIPGYVFKSAKALITNFHQPRSTLLLLVAAFIGDDWKKVYEHALAKDYRFLSYGDSSLLWRADA
ncbi:MAG TPA: S-adenosylmethionine:tRNA ribosyltransferase-isomerase [Chitinophagaceae bacterium]|nr:S-adenosylmethionine:tRNA ribosyltransferase-isomerase [Chitinophagaceae bacterium]